MTETLIQPRVAPRVHTLTDAAKGGASADRPIVSGPMDAATLANLTEAVAERLLNPGRDSGRTGSSAMPVDLRAPIPLEEAKELVANVSGKLEALLSALIGGNDPIQTDDGAEVLASEGAVAQVQPAALLRKPAVEYASQPVTVGDSTTGARPSSSGPMLTSSRAFMLLVMLRELLQDFERLAREEGTQMVFLQQKMTEVSGKLMVEAARERFGGAMAATIFTAAIGGFAMKRMNDSANVQTGSMATNQLKANKTSIQVSDARGQVKAHATPAEDIRRARNIDGSPVSPRADGGRARADLQADTDVDVRSMKPSASGQTNGATENDRQRVHSENMANAQKIAAQGVLGNMVAAPVGNIGAATMEIESKFTDSEQQLMALAAETFKRVADEHQDHAVRNREMRDATTQLVESLMSLQASTSGDIIRHF